MAQSTTFPSVTIQGVVFTAKRWGQFPTITYKNGGTAGSEVVTIDSSLNITIQIASGSSTNTQIVAAVNAATGADGRGPADFVLASTSSGATQPTCTTLVPLAGGVSASTKATLNLGPMLLTAHTAGTGGNSLQIKFTSGATAGSEVVTDPNSNGAPLNVQIADGVSTYLQIKTAIESWQSGHTTYFDLSSNGRSLNQPAHLADASTAKTLSGGVAAAAAAVTVNGLTVTSKTNDATQNGLTVTLTPGGTAGAEVVTVDGSGNVSVQIQSGTSTITQVRTAMNAAGSFSALYTATGTSSTALNAVYQNSMTGAAIDPGYAWYKDNGVTALTSSFVYFPFGSMAEDFHIKNDDPSGNNTIIGSWDGVNNHFILKATESWDAQAGVNRPGVFLKYGTGAPAYRAWSVNR